MHGFIRKPCVVADQVRAIADTMHMKAWEAARTLSMSLATIERYRTLIRQKGVEAVAADAAHRAEAREQHPGGRPPRAMNLPHITCAQEEPGWWAQNNEAFSRAMQQNPAERPKEIPQKPTKPRHFVNGAGMFGENPSKRNAFEATAEIRGRSSLLY